VSQIKNTHLRITAVKAGFEHSIEQGICINDVLSISVNCNFVIQRSAHSIQISTAVEQNI
jgi:hypothetical protein